MMSRAERRDQYAEFVELHRDELRAHCTRILRSPNDAEDALQEALLRAWRSLHQFEGRGSVRSWLYRIATNASLDQMRRHAQPVMVSDQFDAVEPVDDVERRDSLRRLVAAAGRLIRRSERSSSSATSSGCQPVRPRTPSAPPSRR